MSKLFDHAQAEVERWLQRAPSGEDREAEERICRSVLASVGAFASETGHSGTSAEHAIMLLNKLLTFQNLAPLTDDPEEWDDKTLMSGEPMWQNRRNSKAFSSDGGRTFWRIQDGPSQGWSSRTDLRESAPGGWERIESIVNGVVRTVRRGMPIDLPSRPEPTNATNATNAEAPSLRVVPENGGGYGWWTDEDDEPMTSPGPNHPAFKALFPVGVAKENIEAGSLVSTGEDGNLMQSGAFTAPKQGGKRTAMEAWAAIPTRGEFGHVGVATEDDEPERSADYTCRLGAITLDIEDGVHAAVTVEYLPDGGLSLSLSDPSA